MSDQPPSDAHKASINRLKLAVAIAVLRCKPSHVTAQEYTHSLGQSLRKQESDWKDQALKLEAELLRTRQKLASAHLRDAGLDQDQEEYLEWDIEPTQCNTGLETTETCTELAFPTPPSSVPNEKLPQRNLESHLLSNTQFLHNMMRLKSLCESIEHHGALITDTLHTVKASALRAMECLGSYAASHLHDAWLPWKLMNDAISGVVKTLERIKEEDIQEEIVQGALTLVGKLVQLVLHNHCLNDHLTQRRLCCLVTSLATSALLAPQILQRILPLIQTSAAMLRHSINTTSFDPTLYENSFFLLSTMEDILLLSRNASLAHSGGDQTMRVLVELADGLEGCLLHIFDDYPLFSQQVWRVVNILKWTTSTETEG